MFKRTSYFLIRFETWKSEHDWSFCVKWPAFDKFKDWPGKDRVRKVTGI